ncbi:hypothetical protein BH09ACT6_BH09ACT6_03290 [soil metagenome]
MLYISRGSTDLTVAEIASAIGLSERTFYRYFATKQDAIRPVLDWGSLLLAETIRTETGISVVDSIVLGLDLALGGEQTQRTRLLFPLILRDDGLRAILLQGFHDSELYIRPALALRLGVDAESMRARVAAASVLALIRVAVEALVDDGRDPVEAFVEAAESLAAHPFGAVRAP